MKLARNVTLFIILVLFQPLAARSQFVQETKLIGEDIIGVFGQFQGSSVALSSDGNTAIMGGIGDDNAAGAAWVFIRSSGSGAWTRQAKLVGTGAVGNAQQGYAVALSGDGNTAIVGGYADNATAGAAWVFTRTGDVWSQQGNKLVGTGAVGSARQGVSVGLSFDGNTAIVGGSYDDANAGAGWVFTRSGTVWTQQGNKIVGTGATGVARQGTSVAISGDGTTAILGAGNDNTFIGATWIFTRSGSVWTQQGTKLVGTGGVGRTQQGAAVALSGDGNTAIVGGWQDNAYAGAAWVFTRSGVTWSQQGNKLVGTLATGSARQGFSAALSTDGNTAIVGGYTDNATAGAAWIFTRITGVWSQLGNKLVGAGAIGSARQGIAAAVSGDGNTAMVGGDVDDANHGAAWIFSRGGARLFRSNLNKPISDNQSVFDTIQIGTNLQVTTNSMLSPSVSDVNVTIDTIIHPNVDDLEISLIHLGVTDTIVYQVGGTGNDFIGTVFDDSAATLIGNGAPPFTGVYVPSRPLTQFNSTDVAGDWILRVYDRATGNEGTLNAWSLSVTVSDGLTSVEPVSREIPEGFALEQNYPNPFNPSTKIKYQVPHSSFTTLKIVDVLGREVRTLVNENLEPGSYETIFDASGLPSGLYLYRLRSGSFEEVKKLVLLR